MMFPEDIHLVMGISPKTDIYDTNPTSEEVNLKNFLYALFILAQKTAGTNTGTATVTVEECSDGSGTGATAIPFVYRKKTTGASDTWGAWTAATASGFTTTANEDTIYQVKVKADALSESKPFVRMKLTEVVNDPVSGGVVIALLGARYGQDAFPSVLS